MEKHGAAWLFCLLLIFLFFLFLSPFLLPFSPPSLPPSSTPHPTPSPFFFLFVTGLYFYTHPPFREFLKLYFPPYQRGLRLKKPMVPPQSLTLVSSNTSKLLPTCSYSSIQPFSHQVSASLAPFQGREKGEFWKKHSRKQLFVAGGKRGVCWRPPVPHRQPLRPAAQRCPVPVGRGGAGCGNAGFSLLLAEAGWVFSSLTKNQHRALSPQIRILNLLSPSSVPGLTALPSMSLSCRACFAVRPLGLGSGGSESHTRRG